MSGTWSDWQDGYVFPPRGIFHSVLYKYLNPNITDPSTNTVDVLRENGNVQLLQSKPPTWDTYSSEYQIGWYAGLGPEWHFIRPNTIAPLLLTLFRGVEYSVRPDRVGTEFDAYMEFESDVYTPFWTPVAITVLANGGDTPGDFRLKAIFNPPAIDLNPPTTYQRLPLSVWDDSTSIVALSLSAASQIIPYVPQAAYTPPNTATSVLFYVESDTAPGSSSTNLMVGLSPYSSLNLLTPRWRYWIPDAPTFAIPTHTNGRVIHSMIVDCSSPNPVVMFNQPIFTEMFVDSEGLGLIESIPEIGVVILVSGYYGQYQQPRTSGINVMDANDGTLRASIAIDTDDNYAIALFVNPHDPTECAVFFEGKIVVVTGLDTPNPVIARIILNIPDTYSKDDGWPYGVTDLYRPGSVWLSVQNGYADVPIMGTYLSEAGPTEQFGVSAIDPYDAIGQARTPGRSYWGIVGADDNADVYLLQQIVAVTDARTYPPKLTMVPYTVTPLVPNYEEGSLDYLNAGSFTLSANAKTGRVISGYTALSTEIDTTTIPGSTEHPYRYSVLITSINIPPDSPKDPPLVVSGLPNLVRTVVPLTQTWEGFFSPNALGYVANPPPGVVLDPPPSNTSVVGSYPVLTTDDEDVSYLEYVQGPWANPVGDLSSLKVNAVPGIKLAPFAIPPGSRASQLLVEAQMWTSVLNPDMIGSGATTAPLWSAAIIDNGVITQPGDSGGPFTHQMPIGQWQVMQSANHATANMSGRGDQTMWDALAAGNLVVSVGQQSNAYSTPPGWTLRVSSIRVSIVLISGA